MDKYNLQSATDQYTRHGTRGRMATLGYPRRKQKRFIKVLSSEIADSAINLQIVYSQITII